jgi:hypothetical protein
MDTTTKFGSDDPPALTHLFEPPEDYVGSFGWVCGYSADTLFMNDAAERFTRRTKRRRAADGEVALGLILDPGNPRLSAVDVPGVLHLPLPTPHGFALMHAKVALLGFRDLNSAARWRLRLVVSTGNWTRETLEETLDLAWTVEVGSDELGLGAAGPRLADLKAGSAFLAGLRTKLGPSPLDAASRVTAEAVTSLDTWCAEVTATAPKDVTPRFIDSRTRALLPQIVERIAPGRRNYLAMGSGFYEGGGATNLPRVPAKIVEALERNSLQTPQAEIAIFVNPDGCQAVAGAMAAIAKAGWSVRRPGQGSFLGSPRLLHAKFLFGAHSDQRSSRCLRAWLYLGSGNLTHPGLLRAAPAGGNLEAGVVFAPEGLVWDEPAETDAVPVRKLLPIGWDPTTEIAEDALQAGSDMPDRPQAYSPPPVPYLHWEVAPDETGRLLWPAEITADFAVLDSSGTACNRDGKSAVWLGSRPFEVSVAWNEADQLHTERVPVIDEDGRIAAASLAPIAIDEVWALLADFPLPPADDVDEPEDPGNAGAADIHAGRSGRAAPATAGSYSIRRVMELVEQIAARQTLLNEADWTAWCVRLGQTLVQAKDDAEIAAFRALRLNPLSALRARPFRPDFTLDPTTPASQRYEETLDRVAVAWAVADLEPLEP